MESLGGLTRSSEVPPSWMNCMPTSNSGTISHIASSSALLKQSGSSSILHPSPSDAGGAGDGDIGGESGQERLDRGSNIFS